jgi:5-(carboxyamino)imidazole ribonucleotide synthase
MILLGATLGVLGGGQRIVERLDFVGVLGVAYFVVEGGRLLVNELAPRPHNSGHWTLDASLTSQFEQQVHALTGLPLGAI